MKYIVDHDLHIHTHLSYCSKDAEQNHENIIAYAQKRGLKHICITDHFWDAEEIPLWNGDWWYAEQNYSYITSDLPLPACDDVVVHFGCETEVDADMVVGVSPKRYDDLDFIIIPTTHMHSHTAVRDDAYNSLPRRKELFLKRLHAVLDQDLPFHKIGFAHLTVPFIAGMEDTALENEEGGNWENHLKLLNLVTDEEFYEVFKKFAAKGPGLEINMILSDYKTPEEQACVLRPYRIAKDCGVKFYFGTDSHHLKDFDGMTENHDALVEALGLTENDKFDPFR